MGKLGSCNICKRRSSVINEASADDLYVSKEKLTQLLETHKRSLRSCLIQIKERHNYYVCLDCLVDFKEGRADHWGKKITFVDVVCPHCKHKFSVEMRWLVWKYNCEKCKGHLTTDDRIKKIAFNIGDYR